METGKESERSVEEALRKQQLRQQREQRRQQRRQALVGRFSRTALAFFSMAPTVFAFVSSMALIMTHNWTNVPSSAAAGAPTFYLSPQSGNCTCNSTFDSYCAETNDAFQGASYLSVAIVAAEGLIAAVLVYELAAYGVFGGTHDITRLTLLLSLVSMATKMLSLVAFYSAFSLEHCGELSFKSSSYSLGWTFYFRGAELLLMVLFVLSTLRSFSGSTRGPPSGPLLSIATILGLSAFSMLAHGWMKSSNGGVLYSTWEACSCKALCSDTKSMTTAAFGLTCAQAGVALVGSFFVALRAVDNEAITARLTVVFTFLGLALAAAASGVFLAAVKGSDPICGSASTYDLGFGIKLELAIAAAYLISFVLNVIYLKGTIVATKAPTASRDEQMSGSGPSTSSSSTGTSVLLYHTLWWFELKDSRTLSHEARGSADSDVDDSDSDMEGPVEFGETVNNGKGFE